MITTFALRTHMGSLTIELSKLKRDTKTKYHSKLAAKLVNLSTSVKTYWSILKISLMIGKFQLYPHD